MCGRFVASRPVDDIARILAVDDIEVPPELIEPRWNIAPQADVLGLTVRTPKAAPDDTSTAAPRRRLTVYRWGLVPSWAKDLSVGNRMFNARAETLRDKPAFRTALLKRRCLVPADGFYEWEKGKGAGANKPSSPARPRRQPWIFQSPDGDLLTFAGLWEAWRPREADSETGELHDWLLSCTIITTEANETVAPVHDRMPVVVRPEDRDAWLDPGGLDESDLHGLLRPAPSGTLIAFLVSSEVSNSRAEGPQLAEPLGDEADTPLETARADQPTQTSLFDAG
jgi:putative SOS response-associated peptidase YedK